MTLTLAAYWDAEPVGAERQGLFNEMSHGCPSIWALGLRPPASAAGLLWAVPYAGHPHVYVFDGWDKMKLGDTPFGTPGRFEHAAVDHVTDYTFVCQADQLLAGFDARTGLLDGADAGDLGGNLSYFHLGSQG